VRGEKRPADPHHWLYASTHVNSGNSVTLPGHEAATSIAIKVNPETKHVYFSEVNSHLKGAGRRMVESVIKPIPAIRSVSPTGRRLDRKFATARAFGKSSKLSIRENSREERARRNTLSCA
jgi:hypothetical protein